MSHLLPLVFAVLTAPALAHPGDHHDGWAGTLAHLLSEPDHLALILLAVGAGLVGARAMRRRAARSARGVEERSR